MRSKVLKYSKVRKVSLDSEHARSNSTARNANNSDAASGVMGNTRWFDIPLNLKESKLCSEKNGLLTCLYPSMNAPRGACFKLHASWPIHLRKRTSNNR